MEKHLHIISHDVPYPADYGGVYDLFYKLPALQKEGVKIYLHCFDYGRGEQPELNKYCEKVFYYTRNRGYKNLFSTLPYIVSSRRNEELLENLLLYDFPIFMEGVHCTFHLNDKRLAQRKKFVRIHNVEHLYYRHLFFHTQNALKKLYYLRESRLLKRYESELAGKDALFFTVTQKDANYYHKELHCANAYYLPLFLPGWGNKINEGMGLYCLYHGKLSIAENEHAALWLLQNIFSTLHIPFVIAGKDSSQKLRLGCKNFKHVCLIENPSATDMQDLVTKAHIHILPSFNSTGIKIKLLNALFNGRHCVVNHEMVDGTGLESLCHIANTANAFSEIVSQLYYQPFTKDESEARKQLLQKEFNNEANAKQMVQWIWGE